MKLLCWMHRKFRQNSHEALKALVIGQSSVDDQQYFPKQNYGTRRSFKHGGQRPDHGQLRKSFTCLETVSGATLDDDVAEYEDESSSISELFHGFLAIGTLGSSPEAVNAAEEADPAATPTFAISVVENIIAAADQKETETDLKLINDELEKVLADDAFFNDVSSMASRSSHVSTGRSSHGSVITLSGKPDDAASAGGGGVCPLQGYLFGSAIEMSETTATAASAAAVAAAAAGRGSSAGSNGYNGGGGGGGYSNGKEMSNRTSLGELFQRSKAAEDFAGVREEKRLVAEKEAERSAVNIMKKKLKKKMLQTSSRSSAAADTSAPAEKKLTKILHMFHRKVHPESSGVAAVKGGKAQKKKTTHEGRTNNEGQVGPDEDIILCPERALFLKHKLRRYRSHSNPPHLTFDSIDSFANREQWIRTDADYLVLEL